jgi:hypothetical protein
MIREPSASVRAQIIVPDSMSAGRGVDEPAISGVDGHVADSAALLE